jgi:hypothetical protein
MSAVTSAESVIYIYIFIFFNSFISNQNYSDSIS